MAKTCADFDGSCCSSCHDDWEFGYDEPMEIEADDGTVFARVCCSKMDAAHAALEASAVNR